MQSTFYPTVAQTYGVPLDTRNVFTKCMVNPLFPLFLKLSPVYDLYFMISPLERKGQ